MRFAELGMLPDPADIGLQCFGKSIGACFKRVRIVEKDEVKPPQRLRYRGVSTRRQTIGANRLFSEAAYATSFSATSEATASGESTKTTVSARRNQRLDAFPPILEGINLGTIDQRLKAPRFKRRFQPIREGHVLARIGDEDFGFGLDIGGGRGIPGHRRAVAHTFPRPIKPKSGNLRNGAFAAQPTDVRNGSFASFRTHARHVRFTPDCVAKVVLHR